MFSMCMIYVYVYTAQTCTCIDLHCFQQMKHPFVQVNKAAVYGTKECPFPHMSGRERGMGRSALDDEGLEARFAKARNHQPSPS